VNREDAERCIKVHQACFPARTIEPTTAQEWASYLETEHRCEFIDYKAACHKILGEARMWPPDVGQVVDVAREIYADRQRITRTDRMLKAMPPGPIASTEERRQILGEHWRRMGRTPPWDRPGWPDDADQLRIDASRARARELLAEVGVPVSAPGDMMPEQGEGGGPDGTDDSNVGEDGRGPAGAEAAGGAPLADPGEGAPDRAAGADRGA
jgi:hypothetical protein